MDAFGATEGHRFILSGLQKYKFPLSESKMLYFIMYVVSRSLILAPSFME